MVGQHVGQVHRAGAVVLDAPAKTHRGGVAQLHHTAVEGPAVAVGVSVHVIATQGLLLRVKRGAERHLRVLALEVFRMQY